MEEWFIDGYNLLHALGPRNKVPREKLFELLAGFASEGPRRILMVLDGVGNDEELAPYKTKLFQAVYSQSVSADAAIERCLYQKKGRGVAPLVVTKDRAISNMARGMGARVIDTDSFFEALRESRKESEEIRFQQQVKQHGFHRPFDKKL